MKNIIITGANGNLGSVVTRHFLENDFIVQAVVNTEAGRNHFPPHPNLTVHVLELTNENQVQSWITSITARQKIHGAILLAGGFAMGDMQETSYETVQQQIQLNFETAFHMVHFLWPHWLQNNYGRIVFTGARPALEKQAGKNMIAYSLSKSMLFQLASLLNEAGNANNITASVIVPSTIDTPANRKAMPTADFSRWVTPQAIAEILELIFSEAGNALREPVYKLYNQS